MVRKLISRYFPYLIVCITLYTVVYKMGYKVFNNTDTKRQHREEVLLAQGNPLLDDPEVGTVLCTQQQRLSRIDAMCKLNHGVSPSLNTQNAFIDSMNDSEIIKFGEVFFVIPEFRVAGCLNWKAACTTWLTIFYANSIGGKHANETKWSSKENGKARHLNEFPPSEIRTILKTYYKFMTVRHPLSRLVSVYMDKIVGAGRPKNGYGYANALSSLIKKTLKKNTSPGSLSNEANKTVSFTEFLQYIRQGGKEVVNPEFGGHWHDLIVRCQPCKLHFDNVVRVETLEEDQRFIIEHKLRGQGLGMKANVRANISARASPTRSRFQSSLGEYAEVPDELFRAIVQRYREDYQVYGYHFKRDVGGNVTTSCSSGLNNGQPCC